MSRGAPRPRRALAAGLHRRLDGSSRRRGRGIIHALLRDRVGLRRSGGGDPRAHYLHTVLQRGAGSPSAALCLDRGRPPRRAHVEGIGLPGHFGVRVDGVLAEPSDGECSTSTQRAALVAAATGSDPGSLQPAWLRRPHRACAGADVPQPARLLLVDGALGHGAPCRRPLRRPASRRARPSGATVACCSGGRDTTARRSPTCATTSTSRTCGRVRPGPSRRSPAGSAPPSTDAHRLRMRRSAAPPATPRRPAAAPRTASPRRR